MKNWDITDTTTEHVSPANLHQRLLALLGEGWSVRKIVSCELPELIPGQDPAGLALQLDAQLGLEKVDAFSATKMRAVICRGDGQVTTVVLSFVPADEFWPGGAGRIVVRGLRCFPLPWPSPNIMTWGFLHEDLNSAMVARAYADGENRFLAELEGLTSIARFRGQVWQLRALLALSQHEGARKEELAAALDRIEPLDGGSTDALRAGFGARTAFDSMLALLVRRTMALSLDSARQMEEDDIPF